MIFYQFTVSQFVRIFLIHSCAYKEFCKIIKYCVAKNDYFEEKKFDQELIVASLNSIWKQKIIDLIELISIMNTITMSMFTYEYILNKEKHKT